MSDEENEFASFPGASQPLARNPFVVETPEKLEANQITELFIERYTRIESLKQRKHTFTWGARGSGKSMMARFLEPRCQQIMLGSVQSYLAQIDPFVAIYCPCKEGHLNRTELDSIRPGSAAIISEHLLNLLITDRLASCLLNQFPAETFAPHEAFEFAESVLDLFDRASISQSIAFADSQGERKNRPLRWLLDLVLAEQRSIARYLRRTILKGNDAEYEGTTSGYHDFLLPLFQLAKRFSALSDISFFVFLDDADRLKASQQKILNEWVANRDHSVFCLKISARREGYQTMETKSGSLLEQPHDYTEIDVDELYTQSKTDYWNKVKLIADRRLHLSDVPCKDIQGFLPNDPAESELLEESRAVARERWDQEGRPGRQADFVHRYSIPMLFQELRRRKKRKSYAGFDTLVDLSSGVVRDFLEPCYLMFDRLVGSGVHPSKVSAIPPVIQDKVIFKYSEEFLIERFDSLRQQLPPEKWKSLHRLRNLIESLGRLFYERLHDPNSREARVFSFTLRSEPPDDLREVLYLGWQYRYFLHKSYSSKEGGGREHWYILNRRLCPVFKLDPSGFEGRVSLTTDMLELACDNPDQFVRSRHARGRKAAAGDQGPTLFDFGKPDNEE